MVPNFYSLNVTSEIKFSASGSGMAAMHSPTPSAPSFPGGTICVPPCVLTSPSSTSHPRAHRTRLSSSFCNQLTNQKRYHCFFSLLTTSTRTDRAMRANRSGYLCVCGCRGWSCFLSLVSACFVCSQWGGVLRSHLSASLFEHLSMGQAIHPPKLKNHTQYEDFACLLCEETMLGCPVYPRSLCMRVIAGHWAVSDGSQRAARYGHFPGASHVWAQFFPCLDCSPIFQNW